MEGSGWAGWSGVGGKWDNCNSIINKYIKKKKTGGNKENIKKKKKKKKKKMEKEPDFHPLLHQAFPGPPS